MVHALQLDVEQVDNPWRAHSARDRDSPLAPTATGSLHSDADRDDTVSQALARGRDPDMILSPSPPPQSTRPPPPTLSQMHVPETPSPDQNVASLKAIFPDFDDAVILSVLETSGGDHDRALDLLLGMNDPSFVPPTSSPQSRVQSAPSLDAQRLSQEALDEQFARRLALEEQQAAQDVPSYIMYQPYQTRRGGRNSWGSRSASQPQPQGQGGRDTMTEFQEGFNRIAESGKKTFSSLMSKVKAKMQDFDQGQGIGWSGSQNPSPGQTSQPGAPSPYASSYAPDSTGQGAYAQPYASTPAPPARMNTYPTPRSGVRPAIVTEPTQYLSPPQQSYYDPNARGYDLYSDDEATIAGEASPISPVPPSPIAPPPTTTTTGATAQYPAPTPAFPPISVPSTLAPLAEAEVETETESPNVASPSGSSLPSYTSPMLSPSQSDANVIQTPIRSLSPTGAGSDAKGVPGPTALGTGPGATRTMPGGFDFSKLGLLPKRPISLVQGQPPPAAGAGADASAGVSAPRMAVAHSHSTASSSTDQEEPEFVENPFEDQ